MQHRGFAGDGKKLVAGGADPGAGLSAAGYIRPASARPATAQATFPGSEVSRFPGFPVVSHEVR